MWQNSPSHGSYGDFSDGPDKSDHRSPAKGTRMPEDKRIDEPSGDAATEQIGTRKPVAPAAQANGRWHASRAVLIVLGVLATIVIAGLGFAAGYAVGGHGDHHRRADWQGPAMMRDHMAPPPFRGDLRVPFDRGDMSVPSQSSAPTTTVVPTP